MPAPPEARQGPDNQDNSAHDDFRNVNNTAGRAGDHRTQRLPYRHTPARQKGRRNENVEGQQANGISTYVVSVLSKLATRFKDRTDKYAGDDGENWKDVYSSYANCAEQWGVPEAAALRNIEIILSGEAKTYCKSKVQGNRNSFRSCNDVNKFILETFRGREAQEATLEHLDTLSMYEEAKTKGSLVAGLRAVRDETVKHVNLVPNGRPTDLDQKRGLRNAVRRCRWSRPRPQGHTTWNLRRYMPRCDRKPSKRTV